MNEPKRACAECAHFRERAAFQMQTGQEPLRVYAHGECRAEEVALCAELRDFDASQKAWPLVPNARVCARWEGR